MIMTSKRRQKLCSKVSVILLLSTCYRNVNGMVEISPFVSQVAPVCQAGDELVLTCTVSGEFLRWEFTVTVNHGQRMNFMSTITAFGIGGEALPSMVNSTRFSYSRLSTQPLTSTMTIYPVCLGLNGVEITCRDVETTESAATTIQIIGNAEDLHISNFSVYSGFEQFSDQSVTVTVEWSVSLSRLYYHQLLRNASIAVVPDVGVTAIDTGNRTFLLSLMYGIQYIVSLTQPGICGQPNQTAFIILNYARCISPTSLVSTGIGIVGYEDPALNGQSISFTCRPGFEINGPKSSTCMENGRWTPNPKDVNCTVIPDYTTSTSVCSGAAIDDSTCFNSTSNGQGGFAEDSNETLKLSLGIVFGVLAAIVVVIVVVLLAMFLWRKKGFHKQPMRPLDSEYALQAAVDQEDSDGDPNYSTLNLEESTPYYADIRLANPSSHRQSSNILAFDDSCVEYARLNHSVHSKGATTLKVSTREPDNCPPVNLDSLLVQLQQQVGPKWYEFGVAAGIQKEVLDKIASQCPPEQCIVELFDYWLRDTTRSEPLTWKTVADILKAINLTELGNDIESVYTTGVLPIVVDMNRVDLEEEEDELPPPLPVRSNLYVDTPSHTLQMALDRDSHDDSNSRRAEIPSSSIVSAPVVPPKPAHMRSNT